MTEDQAPILDFWGPLRKTTQSRIGLGRAGDSLPTKRVLEFKAAHAAARDAVHEPLDSETLASRVEGVGIGRRWWSRAASPPAVSISGDPTWGATG